MKSFPRKLAFLKWTFALLLLTLGGVMTQAQDTLPNKPAFPDNVHGVVLLNGWNGEHEAENTLIGTALSTGESLTLKVGNGLALHANPLTYVLILDAGVDRPEDASAIQERYNASIVVWWSQDAGKDRLNFAISMPDINQFNQFVDLSAFEMSPLDSDVVARLVYALWLYSSQGYDWQGDDVASTYLTAVIEEVSAEDAAPLYLLRGVSNARMRKYASATADFERILDNESLAAHVYYNRASMDYVNGDYNTAVEGYTQAINRTSDRTLSALAYASRGFIYYSRSEFDPAIADFTQALNYDNTRADVYQTRAQIYASRQQYELAVSDYGRLLALHPNDIGTWELRASTYELMGDYQHAVEDYTAAVKIANDNHTLCQCLLSRRAQAHFKANEYELAIADYEQALTYGEYVRARVGLAEVYTAMNEPEKAQEQLDIVAARTNVGGGDYLTMGEVYEGMGNIQAAGEAFWKWVASIQNERIDTIADASQMMPLEMAQGRVYFIPVTLKAGETLNVTAIGTPDSLLVLLNPSGEPVAGSDDRKNGADFNAEIAAYKASTAGEYIIVLTHAGGTRIGRVNLGWNIN